MSPRITITPASPSLQSSGVLGKEISLLCVQCPPHQLLPTWSSCLCSFEALIQLYPRAFVSAHTQQCSGLAPGSGSVLGTRGWRWDWPDVVARIKLHARQALNSSAFSPAHHAPKSCNRKESQVSPGSPSWKGCRAEQLVSSLSPRACKWGRGVMTGKHRLKCLCLMGH